MVSDPGAQAVCLMFMLASVRVYIIDAFASPPPSSPPPPPKSLRVAKRQAKLHTEFHGVPCTRQALDLTPSVMRCLSFGRPSNL